MRQLDRRPRPWRRTDRRHAGAAGTALFGGHILAGTAIGAGVGALTGAVTDKDTINLGEPPW